MISHSVVVSTKRVTPSPLHVAQLEHTGGQPRQGLVVATGGPYVVNRGHGPIIIALRDVAFQKVLVGNRRSNKAFLFVVRPAKGFLQRRYHSVGVACTIVKRHGQCRRVGRVLLNRILQRRQVSVVPIQQILGQGIGVEKVIQIVIGSMNRTRQVRPQPCGSTQRIQQGLPLPRQTAQTVRQGAPLLMAGYATNVAQPFCRSRRFPASQQGAFAITRKSQTAQPVPRSIGCPRVTSSLRIESLAFGCLYLPFINRQVFFPLRQTCVEYVQNRIQVLRICRQNARSHQQAYETSNQ